MKLYLAILSLLFSSFSNSEVFEKNNDCAFKSDTRISIEIKPSFKNKYKYRFALLDHSEMYCLSLIKYEDDKTTSIKSIELSNEQQVKFLKLYQQAMTFPLNDKYSHSIKDGERWFIESSLYQNLSITIASPDLYPSERGYINLLVFKEFLDSTFVN